MAEITDRRGNTFDLLLYNVAAAVVVIAGVSAFAYVGERMRHGSSKVNIAVETPRTAPSQAGIR